MFGGKKVSDISIHLVDTAFTVNDQPAFVTFVVGMEIPFTKDGKKKHKVSQIRVWPRKKVAKIFYDDGIVTTYTTYKFIFSVKGGRA